MQEANYQKAQIGALGGMTDASNTANACSCEASATHRSETSISSLRRPASRSTFRPEHDCRRAVQAVHGQRRDQQRHGRAR